jgi:hypothetical protein
MQRTIIVQLRRIGKNNKMFDLSINDKPVTPPIWKMEQLELVNSDLGATNFVGNKMKRATPQRVKILIKMR